MVMKIPLLTFVNMPVLSHKQIIGRVISWNYHKQLHPLEPQNITGIFFNKRKLGFF